MKVIKIEKSYRNGRATFVEVVLGDTDEELEEVAETICDNDSSGQVHGYTYKWEVVTDPSEIAHAVSERLKYINERIQRLEAEKKQCIESFPELKTIEEDNDWIAITDRMPVLTDISHLRGGESNSEIVDVKFSDGTYGEGLWRDGYYRSSWMSRVGDRGFLYNRGWSDINVTHWRPKKK